MIYIKYLSLIVINKIKNLLNNSIIKLLPLNFKYISKIKKWLKKYTLKNKYKTQHIKKFILNILKKKIRNTTKNKLLINYNFQYTNKILILGYIKILYINIINFLKDKGLFINIKKTLRHSNIKNIVKYYQIKTKKFQNIKQIINIITTKKINFTNTNSFLRSICYYWNITNLIKLQLKKIDYYLKKIIKKKYSKNINKQIFLTCINTKIYSN